MKKFSDWYKKRHKEIISESHLSVYQCPFCGGTHAYNGDPYRGGRYKGSAKCFECDFTWSVIDVKPLRLDGPLYRDMEI